MCRFRRYNRAMWYRVKMWWFLREFGKQIKLHTLLEPRENLSVGGVITSTSNFFIYGNDEWPGLARRKFWWRMDYCDEAIKRRVVEYNDIFISCVNEGYIHVESWVTDGKKIMNALDPVRGENYDESRGLVGLVQVAAKKFPLFWSAIVAIIGWAIAIIATYVALTKKQ